MPGQAENLSGLITKAIPVGLGMACLFLGQAFLARLMGPNSFGTYSYYLTWITVAALLAKAGHEWVIMKIVPGRIRLGRTGEIRFLVARAAKAVSVRAALAAAILVILALAVGRSELDANILIAGSLLIVALAAAEIRRAVALAYGAIWLAETPENIVKSIFLVLIAVAAVALFGTVSPDTMLWANFIVTVIASAVAVLIFLRLMGKDILSGPATPMETEAHDDLMRTMWLTNLLQIVLRYADILIIGALIDFTSTGIYIAATRIASLASAPVMILDRIVAPPIAEAAEMEDHARIRTSSREYAILATAACAALVIFLVFLGAHFISLLFGSGYEAALSITWILLIGHAANTVTGPTGVLLSMTGNHRFVLIIAGICAVIYLVLLYFWTSEYSVLGVASAFAVTYTAKAVMQTFIIRKRIGVNPTIFQSWSR